MNTVKKYFKVLVFLVPFIFSSCDKWLEVQPKAQVRDSDLFSTEAGFKEALAGVYTALTYEPLYGREMTFGLLGVLGYEWDFQASDYNSDLLFDYPSSQLSLNRIDAIWNGIYNAISNDNKLIEEIDAKRSVFSTDNYEVIKGEALALRAFMHFDLLRVFGASFEESPQKLSIPYYQNSSKDIQPQLRVNDVLDLVIKDLNAAAELLRRDPLVTGRSISTVDDNGYLINRTVHLNYYAVKGLLARVYLYKKDLNSAFQAANEVITANKFQWIAQSNLINPDQADLVFSTEHLFSLNNVRLNSIHENSFTATGGNNVFYISPENRKSYYDNATEDYRYLYWFAPTSTGSFYLNKYAQLTAAGWPASYRNKMPMIKLSEMYFIAAEALKSTDIAGAAKLINTVRTHRGLSETTIDPGNIDAVLSQEFRKEFIGEGQLFFYYKRKNLSRIPRATSFDIIALKGYKLPIPVSEYNNAPGRVDNR